MAEAVRVEAKSSSPVEINLAVTEAVKIIATRDITTPKSLTRELTNRGVNPGLADVTGRIAFATPAASSPVTDVKKVGTQTSPARVSSPVTQSARARSEQSWVAQQQASAKSPKSVKLTATQKESPAWRARRALDRLKIKPVRIVSSPAKMSSFLNIREVERAVQLKAKISPSKARGAVNVALEWFKNPAMRMPKVLEAKMQEQGANVRSLQTAMGVIRSVYDRGEEFQVRTYKMMPFNEAISTPVNAEKVVEVIAAEYFLVDLTGNPRLEKVRNAASSAVNFIAHHPEVLEQPPVMVQKVLEKDGIPQDVARITAVTVAMNENIRISSTLGQAVTVETLEMIGLQVDQAERYLRINGQDSTANWIRDSKPSIKNSTDYQMKVLDRIDTGKMAASPIQRIDLNIATRFLKSVGEEDAALFIREMNDHKKLGSTGVNRLLAFVRKQVGPKLTFEINKKVLTQDVGADLFAQMQFAKGEQVRFENEGVRISYMALVRDEYVTMDDRIISRELLKHYAAQRRVSPQRLGQVVQHWMPAAAASPIQTQAIEAMAQAHPAHIQAYLEAAGIPIAYADQVRREVEILRVALSDPQTFKQSQRLIGEKSYIGWALSTPSAA
ncbi:MAG: hypothetical protein KAR31_10145, partial [Candidatus Omnitrophica bacterium]|nr:hypothetical protein [Candidatus Omnitrophota bacterium]